jgi:hypothetical protein
VELTFQGLQVNHGFDFHSFNRVFLFYDASAVSGTVSVNLSAEGGVLNFSLW